MNRIAALITIAPLAIAASACGGDDGDGAGGSEAIAALFVESGAPEDEAECVAEQLGGYTADDIEAAMEVASVDDLDDDQVELLESIGLAVNECGIT